VPKNCDAARQRFGHWGVVSPAFFATCGFVDDGARDSREKLHGESDESLVVVVLGHTDNFFSMG
jgi:hypothetical protein